jgi:hypothetical protein
LKNWTTVPTTLVAAIRASYSSKSCLVDPPTTVSSARSRCWRRVVNLRDSHPGRSHISEPWRFGSRLPARRTRVDFQGVGLRAVGCCLRLMSHPLRSRAASSSQGLQTGQGSPGAPQVQARGPSHGRSGCSSSVFRKFVGDLPARDPHGVLAAEAIFAVSWMW